MKIVVPKVPKWRDWTSYNAAVCGRFCANCSFLSIYAMHSNIIMTPSLNLHFVQKFLLSVKWPLTLKYETYLHFPVHAGKIMDWQPDTRLWRRTWHPGKHSDWVMTSHVTEKEHATPAMHGWNTDQKCQQQLGRVKCVNSLLVLQNFTTSQIAATFFSLAESFFRLTLIGVWKHQILT